MAAVELEINSFVSKFAQLCVCGINASLNFTNSNGSLSANLKQTLDISILLLTCPAITKTTHLLDLDVESIDRRKDRKLIYVLKLMKVL